MRPDQINKIPDPDLRTRLMASYVKDRRITLVRKQVKSCEACGLRANVRSPVPFSGPVPSPLVFVGESPGHNENKFGIPFVGKAGQLFDHLLTTAGLARDDVFVMNTLNCVTENTQVESPSIIHKGFKRWYVGPFVTIKTESGIRLTVTPNHPILTDHGWIAAGQINHGFNLVRKTGGKPGMVSSDPNPQNEPVPIHQLLGFLAESGTSERTIGSVMNFHGDGLNTYVNVVSPNRLLESGTEMFDQSCQLQFVGSHHAHVPSFGNGGSARSSFSFSRGNESSGGRASINGKGFSLFESQLFHPQRSGLRTRPSTDMKNIEPSENLGFGNVIDFTQFPGAKTIQVLGSDIRRNGKRLGSSPTDFNSQFNEPPTQNTRVDTQSLGEILHGLPFQIALDKVIEVSQRQSSGHVYNLETSGGYYLANSIVTHNCRPPDNRDPFPREIEACKPNLKAQLDLSGAWVGVTLGSFALAAVTNRTRSQVKITAERGDPIALDGRIWIPTFHPAYALRNMSAAKEILNDIRAAKRLQEGEESLPSEEYAKAVSLSDGDLLERLADRGHAVVKLTRLGDVVLVVRDALVDPPTHLADKLTIYTLEELLRMGEIGKASRFNGTDYKRIHLAKKILGATVVS